MHTQPYPLSQTLLPPGRKQMETHWMLRNSPEPNQLSIINHRNGSPGLKLATGIYKNITTNTILDNYQNFSEGFMQGIILTAISQPNESSLPKKKYTGIVQPN